MGGTGCVCVCVCVNGRQGQAELLLRRRGASFANAPLPPLLGLPFPLCPPKPLPIYKSTENNQGIAFLNLISPMHTCIPLGPSVRSAPKSRKVHGDKASTRHSLRQRQCLVMMLHPCDNAG